MSKSSLRCVRWLRTRFRRPIPATPARRWVHLPWRTLWAKQMNHNPADPKWRNRDRFVLSAGHASAMLYSLLHLFGYGLTMDDLKNFRQLDSKTPGHPEYGHTVGVETTTGPAGPGRCQRYRHGDGGKAPGGQVQPPRLPVVDHYTYALMGDGCVMEGSPAEASALAATLGLGKLILFYDSNDTSPSRARWSWRCAKIPPSATNPTAGMCRRLPTVRTSTP